MELRKFLGKITKFIFTNKAYAIAVFKLFNSEKDSITIEGQISSLTPEFLYEIEGDFKKESISNNRITFVVSKYRSVSHEIDSRSYWIEHLSSSAFSGVGKILAEKIYDHYKEGIQEKILQNKDSLMEIPSMTREKAELIYLKLLEFKNTNKYYEFFVNNNLEIKFLERLKGIVNKEEKIKEKLENCVYEFCRAEKLNIDFLEIDKIEVAVSKEYRKDFDVFKFSLRRMAWIFWNIVTQRINSTGDTFVYKTNVMDLFLSNSVVRECLLNSNKSDSDFITEILKYANDNSILTVKQISVDDNSEIKKVIISPYEVYLNEDIIKEKIIKYYNSKPLKILLDNFKIEKENINFESLFKIFVKNNCENYLKRKIKIEEWKNVFQKYYESNFLIITGGPGTGKSTIISLLVLWHEFLFGNERSKVLLAPTGRSASRIRKTLRDSKIPNDMISPRTIHSYLKFDGENFAFQKEVEENDYVEQLIVDECSMVDNNLFSSLLKTCVKNKKVVLIGDIDQLPSIGQGQVFEDIIIALRCLEHNKKEFKKEEVSCKKCLKDPVIELRKCYRQESGGIVELAKKIISEENNSFSREDFKNIDGVEFIDISKIDNPMDLVTEKYIEIRDDLWSEFLPMQTKERYIKEINEIQILTPIKKKEKPFSIGFEEKKNYLLPVPIINSNIQAKTRNFKDVIKSWSTKYATFLMCDKVMCTENQIEPPISNGDIGFIQEYTGPKELKNTDIKINFSDNLNNDVSFPIKWTQRSSFTLGYACTIHKSQGSEYENVILCLEPIDSYSSFITKKMVYTAITRAKKKIYIYSTYSTFNKVCNKNQEKRNTRLKNKIQDECKKWV